MKSRSLIHFAVSLDFCCFESLSVGFLKWGPQSHPVLWVICSAEPPALKARSRSAREPRFQAGHLHLGGVTPLFFPTDILVEWEHGGQEKISAPSYMEMIATWPRKLRQCCPFFFYPIKNVFRVLRATLNIADIWFFPGQKTIISVISILPAPRIWKKYWLFHILSCIFTCS